MEKEEALKFKGTLVLFAVSLIIGSLYFLVVLPHVRERELHEELSNRFFRFDAGKVEFLRIRNPQGVFDLVREQGQWRIKTPRSLPVDNKVFDNILGVVRNGKIVKLITGDPGNLADYGLQRPVIAFSLGYEGKIDELALGDVNPAGTGVYAFAKGIKAVFLLDREIPKVLNVGLYELRSKALFAFDPDAITRIRVRNDGREIDLRRDDHGWVMARPIAGKAGEETVRKFLTDILSQRAEEIYDEHPPKNPVFPRSIGITLASGRAMEEHTINVRYWGTGEREGVVAHQNGMAYSGRLAREFWAVVDRDASSFLERGLFPVREQDIGRIRVSRGATSYELARKGDSWYIDDRQIDGKTAMKFVWFLRSWNAVKIQEPNAVFQKGTPAVEVSVMDRAGAVLASLQVYGKTGDRPAGYTKEGNVELYHAVSDALKAPCIVTSSDLKGVPGKEEFIQ